jgi:hypothetical protein
MALHDAGDPHHKSLAEHGVCFGTVLVVLAAIALALQWVLHLMP